MLKAELFRSFGHSYFDIVSNLEFSASCFSSLDFVFCCSFSVYYELRAVNYQQKKGRSEEGIGLLKEGDNAQF
jgi:hypothetical protein